MVRIPAHVRSLHIHIFLWLFLLKRKQAKVSLCSHHITKVSVSNLLKQWSTFERINQDYFLFPSFSSTRVMYTDTHTHFTEFSNTYGCWRFLPRGNTSPEISKPDPQSQQGKVLLWITPFINGGVNHRKAVQGAQTNSVCRLSPKVFADNTHIQKTRKRLNSNT